MAAADRRRFQFTAMIYPYAQVILLIDIKILRGNKPARFCDLAPVCWSSDKRRARTSSIHVR
jgi:hypothetical protein